MTRQLPHVGLRTGRPVESLYGDNSTIGARGQAERAAMLDEFSALLGVPSALFEAPGVIRVQATVGEPLRELDVVEAEVIP